MRDVVVADVGLVVLAEFLAPSEERIVASDAVLPATAKSEAKRS